MPVILQQLTVHSSLLVWQEGQTAMDWATEQQTRASFCEETEPDEDMRRVIELLTPARRAAIDLDSDL